MTNIVFLVLCLAGSVEVAVYVFSGPTSPTLRRGRIGLSLFLVGAAGLLSSALGVHY